VVGEGDEKGSEGDRDTEEEDDWWSKKFWQI
jgi:hypothetical protein